MADPVRTGLVGAGPWATVMHAPLLAGGPGTSLEAVWARREDAATELAQQYGSSVAGSFD
jgi:predicted dehydrogenase